MSNILREIEAEISEAKHQRSRIDRKIADLEEAAERLRPYYESREDSEGLPRTNGAVSTGSSEGSLPSRGHRMEGQGSLAGVRIEDAAEIILREAGSSGLPADEIAQSAIDRGYRSTSFRNPDSDPKKIMMSFRVTLRRLGEKFEQDGRLFRLREPREQTQNRLMEPKPH